MDKRSSVEELKLSQKCMLLIDEDDINHSDSIIDHIAKSLEIKYEAYYTPDEINDLKRLFTIYKNGDAKSQRIIHLINFDEILSGITESERMWEDNSLFMKNIFKVSKELGLTLIITLKKIDNFPEELFKYIDYLLVNTIIIPDLQEIKRKAKIAREDFVETVADTLKANPEMVYVVSMETRQENIVYYGN